MFNGGICNYREPREALTKADHKFLSESDTEIVVHGYEQWGLDGILSGMVGMWGFAILDQNRIYERRVGIDSFAG